MAERARPRPVGPLPRRPDIAAALALAGVAAWHVLAAVAVVLEFRALEAPAYWRVAALLDRTAGPLGARAVLFAMRFDAAQLLGALVGIEGVLAYLWYRYVEGRTADLGAFVRLWWWTCLRATPGWIALVAVGWYGIWQWGLLPAASVVLLVALGFLVSGPASLARARHRRARRARWRPVCPECGFAIYRVVEPRCPECGNRYPADPRRRRRWAWQRLPWDRVRDGGWLAAWLRTLGLVMLRPWRAGARVTLADRWTRACVFAVMHVVVLSLLLGLIGSGGFTIRWFAVRWLGVAPPAWATVDASYLCLPVRRTLIWYIQSCAICAGAMCLMLGTAAACAWLSPAPSPVCRLARLKWTLYSSAGLVTALLLGTAYSVVYWWQNLTNAWLGGQWVFPAPYDQVAAIAYGLSWALGMAFQPHARHRGLRTAVEWLSMWGVAIWVVVDVLFPAGALGWLL